MRTTLTIDDPLLRALRQRALSSGKPFKQVVNEVLRAGLSDPPAAAAPPYQCPAFHMGQPHPQLDLRKTLSLADRFDDEARLEKGEQRR